MHQSNSCGLPLYEISSQSPPVQAKSCCSRCLVPFGDYEKMAVVGREEIYHIECFVCAQCFKPFHRNDFEYYDYKGRKYCLEDFMKLFAPFCLECNEFIVDGRFIRCNNECWHVDCLKCYECKQTINENGHYIINSESRIECSQCNKDSLSLVVNLIDDDDDDVKKAEIDIELTSDVKL